MSFTRFLGLEFEDDIPDGTTLWLFREKLAQAGLVEKLFERFNQHLNAKGETPAAWEEKPAKNQQKDKDARWTKKHGKSFFGYRTT